MTVDSSYPSFYLIPSLSQAHTLSPFFFFFSPPEIPLWFISRPTYYSRFFLLVPHDGCPSKLEGRAWKPSVYTWLPTPQKDKRNSLAFILVRSLEKSYTLHPTPPHPTTLPPSCPSHCELQGTCCSEGTSDWWNNRKERNHVVSDWYKAMIQDCLSHDIVSHDPVVLKKNSTQKHIKYVYIEMCVRCDQWFWCLLISGFCIFVILWEDNKMSAVPCRHHMTSHHVMSRYC